MVRTYAINALTQSSDNIFSNNSTRNNTWNANTNSRQPSHASSGYYSQTPPEDPAPPPIQSPNRQYSPGVQLPPLQLQQYNMPSFLHSPFVDPVGSIVGLRVVYSEGKIIYVPVEPHINYLINQQFGASEATPPSFSPLSSNRGYQAAPTNQQPQQYLRQERPLQEQRQEYQQQFPTQREQQVAQRRYDQSQYDQREAARWLPNRVETPQSVQSLPPVQNKEPSHNVRRRSTEMKGDYWFPDNPQPRSGVRRSREWRNDVDTDFYPWGRGGGGSPLKDSMGNLIADRRVLGRSWSTVLPTNIPLSLENTRRSAPHSIHYGLRNEYNAYYQDQSTKRMPSFAPMSASTSMPNITKGPMSDADQHRLELAKQIEENKRRKELEKQKERDIEEREMRKHEEYLDKQRREEEDDKRRQKEQAIVAERRSQQIYQEQQERARQARRQNYSPPRHIQEVQERPNSAAPRELEWWEKKPTWQQKAEESERKSAVIPSLRGKPPRTPSAQRTASRQSQQRYDPGSSIQEHADDRERQVVEREASARARRPSRRNSFAHNQDNDNGYRSMEQEQPRSATPMENASNMSNDARGRPTAFVIQ